MRSCEACGITSDDPDCIHCTKESVIAEAAQEALKDLDESLLDVDTNCDDADEDADKDANEDADEDNDCDDNEEIDILWHFNTFLYHIYNIVSHIPIVVHS